MDLNSYKGKVPKVSECENYFEKQNEDGTCTMKTKMGVKVIPGYGVSSVIQTIRLRLFAPSFGCIFFLVCYFVALLLYHIILNLYFFFHTLFQYTSFYDHTYSPAKDSVTWRLDYDKKSDFDDVSGHWHLEDHPTKPDCTRVFYACDIKLKGSVPGPVVNFVSKSALKAATGWVKKESEKNPEAQPNLSFVDKSKISEL